MYFYAIASLNTEPLTLVDQFLYLGSNFSSTESNLNTRWGKSWTAIDTIWKSDLSDKIKRKFFKLSQYPYMIALLAL